MSYNDFKLVLESENISIDKFDDIYNKWYEIFI